MIFIVNETNEKLELSTTALDNGASLDLKVGDSAAITIATTSDKEITSEIKKRYSDGEAIKNKLSRHNFKLTASRMYMDNSGETGVNLVAVNPENLPERYKYVKDVIAVVHNSLDEVTMEVENLNGAVRVLTTEQGDYTITIFAVKWYNWSKLSTPVSVYVNGKAQYNLGTVPSKQLEGRKVNAVLKKDKQPKPSKKPHGNNNNRK